MWPKICVSGYKVQILSIFFAFDKRDNNPNFLLWAEVPVPDKHKFFQHKLRLTLVGSIFNAQVNSLSS